MNKNIWKQKIYLLNQSNPVLAKNEIGIVIFSDETEGYVIGDGITPFNEMVIYCTYNSVDEFIKDKIK